MNKFKEDFLEAKAVLEKFLAEDENFASIGQASDLLVKALQSGHKIISCGNGGSMSDAMHFAEELTGRFREDRQAIAALSISDPSHITCAANDYGFDAIFSRFIEAHGQPGDALLAISTSGNSANVCNAAKAARNSGMRIVSLTGLSGGKLKSLSDVTIRVPHEGYSDRIQEMHIKIIHVLIKSIELNL